MVDIFISYRREDTAHAAGRLFSELTRHVPSERIFMDVNTIPFGVDFVDVLQAKVAECKVLLVVIGSGWLDAKDELGQLRLSNEHDFVRIEIAAALARNIPVVPVLLDHVHMPRVDGLPANLKALARRNALFMSHLSFGSDVERLVKGLGLVGGTSTTNPPERPRPSRVPLPMVDVPPGRCRLGLEPAQVARIFRWVQLEQLAIDLDSLREALEREAPADAAMPAFRIGETLVTNQQFAAFVDETGYRTTAEMRGEYSIWRMHRESRPDHPVVHVSFADALAYCKWSDLALPTAEQWKRAFRGNDRRVYPWGDEFDPDKCNAAESNLGNETTPVRRFPRGTSPVGCFDMVGNVQHWTASEERGHQVVVGSSWAMSCAIYGIPVLRRLAPTDYYAEDLGFRCVNAAVSPA